MINVLIADDQAVVRSGFRVLLDAEPDLRVVGEAENGAQAISLARTRRADIVLMDVKMPFVDGSLRPGRSRGATSRRTTGSR